MIRRRRGHHSATW